VTAVALKVIKFQSINNVQNSFWVPFFIFSAFAEVLCTERQLNVIHFVAFFQLLILGLEMATPEFKTKNTHIVGNGKRGVL
jgi:hypothetical protein